MARNRTISPDFWTWEAVIDCAPMARLLFLGLWNFADDHGVQPFRPRTIRMQVFPGDDIDTGQVRAMIDELAAQGLVRLYSVEDHDYISIVDWEQFQRVGKRARRRFPSPCEGQGPRTVPREPPLETIESHSIAEASQSPSSAAPAFRGEKEDEPARWREWIRGLFGLHWPDHARIEQMDDAAAERWMAKWIAEGCDFGHDIAPALRDFYAERASGSPPADLGQLDPGVTGHRLRRAAQERARIAA